MDVNEWFLTLPLKRQAVLREDKWMLANAAAQAAIKAERERCALIADKQARKVNSSWIAQEIAYDIRRGIEA